MELNPKQQTIELIKSAKRMLVLTHENPDGDAIGSILALTLALKKIGKEVDAIVPDPLPEVFKFLPGQSNLAADLSAARDFIIALDTSQTQVERLGYRSSPEDNKLNIVVTPKNGVFQPENVSFVQAQPKYDLIVVLDSPDLDRLGKLYDENTDLFYETPLINIDHHSSNDYFGKVNWIDLTATSTCEVLVALIEALGRDQSLLDADIATLLLTGLTTDTGSFQNANTTPKSFTVAAQLVAAGAHQQEIIRQIFKTKPLTTLRIWGRVLVNLHEEPNLRFIWSKVTAKDIEETKAVETELSGVVDELMKAVPGIDFALLLSERKGAVHGSLRSVEQGVNVSEVAALFSGGGHEMAAAFHIDNAKLAGLEEEIITRIRGYQTGQLARRGINPNKTEEALETIKQEKPAEPETGGPFQQKPAEPKPASQPEPSVSEPAPAPPQTAKW